MKTRNEVLHFLNKLDLVADLERDAYKTFQCIKKVLATDFQDFNTEKLINMLGVDDIDILFINQDFQKVRVSTTFLPDDIFLLFN